jgi:hypothetical protein
MSNSVVDNIVGDVLKEFGQGKAGSQILFSWIKNTLIPDVARIHYNGRLDEAEGWVREALRQLCDKNCIKINRMFLELTPEGERIIKISGSQNHDHH